MAKLKTLNALNPHEWMSLAGGVLVAGASYALLIHPSLQSLADLPRCREDKQAVQHELDQAHSTLQRTEAQIAESKIQLSKMGGGPPPTSQKDRQIARLTALADRCRVKIMQYVPIDVVEHVDHQAFMVEFVGQGNFLDIQRLFGLIESTVAFVDVPNFAISRVQADETSQCLVTWTCRINGVRPDLKEAALAAGGSGPRDRVRDSLGVVIRAPSASEGLTFHHQEPIVCAPGSEKGDTSNPPELSCPPRNTPMEVARYEP